MAARVEEQRRDRASFVPVHPFLFALYPILRLYGENLYEVGTGDVIIPLLVTLALTAVGLVVASLLLRDVLRGAIVTSAVVLVVLLFGPVRDLLVPFAAEARLLLLVLSAAIVVGAVITAVRIGPRLRSTTVGLNVISLVLVVVAAVPAVQAVAVQAALDPDDSALEDLATSETSTQRDVYHLVLDRYGSQASLEAGFGIDNAEFVTWLRDQGFQVVDDSYANYAKTTLSLGATLGIELLDDIAAEMGARSENLSPVVARIRRSRAGRFLQDHGYEYVHIGSWFNQTRESRIADRSYSPEIEVTFGTTLYDSTILPELVDLPAKTDDFARKHADSAEYQWDVLDAVVDDPGPKYVLAHFLVPHPPYVFLADGRYDPEGATYRSQVGDTNRRLREFVEPLLALPEAERPIIILQADEGPFPDRLDRDQDGFDWREATDDEVLTKFGILNAMYLPGPEGLAPLPVPMTAVNTYPELFRRYFGSDIANLPDRILASSRATPYDYIDLTERVAEISAARSEAAPGS